MTAAQRADVAPDDGRVSRAEVIVATAVAALISTLFVVLASAHGAFGVARNDDWAFFRIVFEFAEDGQFHLDGWVQMMLVGHVVLAWPVVEVFGESIRALQVLSVGASALGVLWCYALLRRFIPVGWSAVACLALLLGPVFAPLAVSYMTDGTAFAAQMLTLLLGVRALESRPTSRWLLAASAVAGIVALSIREYSIVAFPAVLVVAYAQSRAAPEARRRLFRLLAGFAVTALLLFVWRRSLPNSIAPTLDARPGPGDVKDLAQFAMTLGLFISPVVLAISPLRAFARAWASNRLSTLCALGSAAACIAVSSASFLGNYVTPAGSYSGTTRVNTAPPVIPEVLFTLARVLGAYAVLVGALVLACALAEVVPLLAGRDGRRALADKAAAAPAPATVLVFSVSLGTLYFVVIAATNNPFFDRYVIVLVPFAAALAVVAGLRYDLLLSRSTLVAIGGVAIIAVLGFVYTDAAATIDGAKWRAAQRLTEAGFRPETIDGGYEWFGYHQSDDATLSDGTSHGSLGVRLFSPRPVCATIVLNGRELGARQTGQHAEVLSRADARTLLGRRVIVTAVRGPDSCG